MGFLKKALKLSQPRTNGAAIQLELSSEAADRMFGEYLSYVTKALRQTSDDHHDIQAQLQPFTFSERVNMSMPHAPRFHHSIQLFAGRHRPLALLTLPASYQRGRFTGEDHPQKRIPTLATGIVLVPGSLDGPGEVLVEIVFVKTMTACLPLEAVHFLSEMLLSFVIA